MLTRTTILITIALLALPTIAQNRAKDIHRWLTTPALPGVAVVAHRGHMATEPENSVPAITSAIAAGAHIVEIDVARTSDGHYVLMHDATLNRTTTGKGKLTETTLEQLKQTQLVFGIRPTAHRPPTLAEAFEAARGKVLLNLDPKDLSLPDAIELARKHDMLDHCVFKQRWDKLDEPARIQLKQLHEKHPELIFMPIVASIEEARAAIAFHRWPALEVVFTDPADRLFTKAGVAELKTLGTRVWVNALLDGRWSAGLSDRQAVYNPDQVYGRFLDLGYDIIQTDLTELLVPVIHRRGQLLN